MSKALKLNRQLGGNFKAGEGWTFGRSTCCQSLARRKYPLNASEDLPAIGLTFAFGSPKSEIFTLHIAVNGRHNFPAVTKTHRVGMATQPNPRVPCTRQLLRHHGVRTFAPAHATPAKKIRNPRAACSLGAGVLLQR